MYLQPPDVAQVVKLLHTRLKLCRLSQECEEPGEEVEVIRRTLEVPLTAMPSQEEAGSAWVFSYHSITHPLTGRFLSSRAPS